MQNVWKKIVREVSLHAFPAGLSEVGQAGGNSSTAVMIETFGCSSAPQSKQLVDAEERCTISMKE